MAVEWRKCGKLSWSLCDGDCDKCNTIATTETAYNRYIDTTGNYHWTSVYSGEHIVRMNNEERREDETD